MLHLSGELVVFRRILPSDTFSFVSQKVLSPSLLCSGGPAGRPLPHPGRTAPQSSPSLLSLHFSVSAPDSSSRPSLRHAVRPLMNSRRHLLLTRCSERRRAAGDCAGRAAQVGPLVPSNVWPRYGAAVHRPAFAAKSLTQEPAELERVPPYCGAPASPPPTPSSLSFCCHPDPPPNPPPLPAQHKKKKQQQNPPNSAARMPAAKTASDVPYLLTVRD